MCTPILWVSELASSLGRTISKWSIDGLTLHLDLVITSPILLLPVKASVDKYYSIVGDLLMLIVLLIPKNASNSNSLVVSFL